MAYCIPYTYTKLSETLHKLKKQNQKSQFLQVNKLCTSLGGLEVPLLIIHEQTASQIPTKCVIITGRAHPGQSNGSYMMEGFIQFLCGESKQARYLRRNLIFKIVPMLNPDGVTLGNYRTGISGKDFNREYRNPDKTIFPEVHAFKKMASQNKSIFGQNLLMFLDFHGHSIKKNVFMYGPQFPIIQKNYYESRIFPKIIGNRTKMFRYYSCSFKISYCKQNTARAIFLRRLMIPLSYTIEASNGSFYDHEKLRDIPFSDKKWKQMGNNIALSLSQYANMVFNAQKFRMEKAKQRKKKKEINIRRSANKLNSKRQMVLTGIQDTQIKHFFQEIKLAQERRELQKVSDDEISEGSSDNEGKQDDLPPEKMNQLYKMIKKKKFQIDDEKNIKIKYRTQGIQKFKNQNKGIQETNHYQVTVQEQKNEQIFEEKIVNTPKMALRKKRPFFKNKDHANFLVSEDKTKKQKNIAAKVINFSFINTKKVRNSEMLSSIRNRKNLFEAYMVEKSGRANGFNQAQQFSNTSMVLDLSDLNKDKNLKRESRNETRSRQGTRNILKQGYSLSFKGRKFRMQESFY